MLLREFDSIGFKVFNNIRDARFSREVISQLEVTITTLKCLPMNREITKLHHNLTIRRTLLIIKKISVYTLL